MSLPIHNTNTRVLYVDGLPCVVDSAEWFALILEEKLGMDFADYFRNYAENCVDASTCEGGVRRDIWDAGTVRGSNQQRFGAVERLQKNQAGTCVGRAC